MDFLFKHAKWSMKSRLRNQRRKESKEETHWPENFKYDNRWLYFYINSHGPLTDSRLRWSPPNPADNWNHAVRVILFISHIEFEKLKQDEGYSIIVWTI